ncbi:sulfite exporter TauE/SafE family protein [Synechococcus sp. CCY9201]|uniref:sulfite exporter TauE/SafE family protein n=1 Tax=Synechococcus sp. CCY9201 TaxID=174697 RepID=UPI002B211013|nr:sulfite exporter TauE/SafE family protein [Synechococcus sp. CCY9201]MEA5475502.1 sulfite exporter TauE/SafE family protein [Synechococcus sp. CCY9201]
MEAQPGLWLTLGLVAFLYASVGHAGASGYIAALSLFGTDPETIRPTALLLNVVVAALGSWQFIQAGHLRWRRFWPLVLLSIPGAFLGGSLALPKRVFQSLVGVILLGSALRFLQRPQDPEQVQPPGPATLVSVGGSLGFLAGLTGTGGGVFLSPLMLLAGWSRTRETAAVAVIFILVNSLAGLAGLISTGRSVPAEAWPLIPVVVLLGGCGAALGSRVLPVPIIRRCLALVLSLAGVRLLLGD